MKHIPQIIGIFVLLLAVVPAIAQPGGDPEPVPIDGGASALAAAGIAYGIKKYRDSRKPAE